MSTLFVVLWVLLWLLCFPLLVLHLCRLSRWTGYRRYGARCGHHSAPCPVCGSTPDVEDLADYRAEQREQRP